MSKKVSKKKKVKQPPRPCLKVNVTRTNLLRGVKPTLEHYNGSQNYIDKPRWWEVQVFFTFEGERIVGESLFVLPAIKKVLLTDLFTEVFVALKARLDNGYRFDTACITAIVREEQYKENMAALESAPSALDFDVAHAALNGIKKTEMDDQLVAKDNTTIESALNPAAIGSSFDDLLQSEGILEDCTAVADTRVDEFLKTMQFPAPK